MFDYGSAALVLLNSLTIGLQTDLMARNLSIEPPLFCRVLETCFCVIFSLEVALRTIAQGTKFFTGSGWKWNLFDLLLVGMQVADEIVSFFALGKSKSGFNFSFMRVLRILRLIRVIRIIRILRLIGELRTIVSSIMGSLKSLIWTVILLFLVVYVTAVYFTQLVLEYRIELQNRGTELHNHDGTLASSFGTLAVYLDTLPGYYWWC